MDFERLQTVHQTAQANPGLNENSLRWAIYNAKKNGLARALVELKPASGNPKARRLMIDPDLFAEWLAGRTTAGEVAR